MSYGEESSWKDPHKEILLFPPSIFEHLPQQSTKTSSGCKMRTGNIAVLLNWLRKTGGLAAWPATLKSNETTSATVQIIDLMSKIRSYWPARYETVKSSAERLLLSLLNDLPEGIPEVQIVANWYDGLFGKLTDTRESISLKSACRLQRGKGKNLQISALSTIEEWDAVLASSASKRGLLKILYETWEQMGDQLPNALNLFLSGGFKERFKVSPIKRGCITTLPEHCDCEECLSSRHKEAEQRLMTYAKYAIRYTCSIVCIPTTQTWQ